MFSLNVSVPGAVGRLASELHPQLVAFDRIRERHTLVVKRFDADQSEPTQSELRLARLREELRPVLAGTPAFEAQLTGLEYFAEPTRGAGPVVYLAVASPGLRALHESLIERFGAIEGLEGDDYVPHVTLARGGSTAAAERLADIEIEPISWTVSKLVIWDSRYREPVGRFGLPA